MRKLRWRSDLRPKGAAVRFCGTRGGLCSCHGGLVCAIWAKIVEENNT
jgi:hypothetical protein